MKLLTRTLSLLEIASTALFFVNCGGGGNDKNPQEVENSENFLNSGVLSVLIWTEQLEQPTFQILS